MSSPSSSRPGSSSESSMIGGREGGDPDYVRMLVFSEDRGSVLLVAEDDSWDLPYFEYPNPIFKACRIRRCCHDLNRLLGVSSSAVRFTATVELLGDTQWESKHEKNCFGDPAFGAGRLVMVEAHPPGCMEDLSLPQNMQWKKADVLYTIAETSPDHKFRVVMDTILNCMLPESSILTSITDPRYQRGWFQKACDFFTSVIGEDGATMNGHVVQEQVKRSSTLLSAESSKGQYYAKSPAQGNNEMSISSCLASLFPESCPEILASNTTLRCFVSRGFAQKPPESKDIHRAVRKLGSVQLASVSHLNALKDAGCPLRGLADLEKQIVLWGKDERITGTWFIDERYQELMPIALQICKRLKDFNIPLTLVHGDFALSNAAYRDPSLTTDDILLFDWQFACISHPFCDFHRLCDEFPKDMLEEAKDEYLSLWTSFEDAERLREALELARKLGWFLKMWTVCDCAAQCKFERRSSWTSWMEVLVNQLSAELVDDINGARPIFVKKEDGSYAISGDQDVDL